MRVLRVRVPADRLAAVRSELAEMDVEPVVVPEESDDGEHVVLEAALPSEAVEDVFARLADAGVEDPTYATVTAVETARARGLETLEADYVAGRAGQEAISVAEIRTKAREMHPNTGTYYVMTLLSAVVATAGLLINSPAVVVGSMVIAPQVSSALLTSVGAVVDDRELLSEGVTGLVGGLALAVVGATAFGLGLQAAAFVPPVLDVSTIEQVSQRISPGVLSLAVAVCAGAAGAVAFATALPVSLVGVMVAAALIPAAAAVGIGIAWGIPSVALGSLLLLVVNAAAITLLGAVTLRLLDYRPESGQLASTESRDGVGIVTTGRVALVALAVVFLVGLVPMVGQIGFERDANAAVQDVLSDDRYTDLELVGVTATRASGLLGDDRNEVQVVVSRPASARVPDLAARIDRRVERSTGRSVVVTVSFRDRQSTRSRLGDLLVAPRTVGRHHRRPARRQ